ncbi:hypothetical protein GFY24_34730 [Nocardia sp. SYP-A9097]|uniref:WXG100 family type VII secretion target n=1 Tax=Nocardia sp. SYP-A9097 TaxID=2663237 RepID=UPI00129A43E6|nr:hypothetical protein [Nocardia sp. SYP-A9097]MRH92519.1 hypothetical protein [Nocardia sp. SYP-A9097]
MASKVGASTSELRGAAGKMDQLNVRLTGILNRLESSLSAKGDAWGNDSYGATFAEGDQGYKAAHENLKTGFTHLATTFKSYSDGQHDAATLLDGIEQRNRRGFGRA